MYSLLPKILYLVLIATLTQSCSKAINPGNLQFSLNYQKHTLKNGLDVILHVDNSDPMVAVAVTYHVGSARERKGKTGFAHLFEHLLFLGSENLDSGGMDTLVDRIGGTMNGSTSKDRTNYFHVLPRNALEKVLWAEADRMGFFINTVSEEIFEKEKQVVKNEKRQSYDNQPAGQLYYLIDKNLYPPNHPYSWQIIGSLKDLDNANVNDAREFHKAWYGPNNATLVISGDFDPQQTLRWIKKYFGEITSTSSPEPIPALTPVELTSTKRLFYEDPFANLPTLVMTWPTVEQYHPDSYPLKTLAALLADGKRSPLYATLVNQEKVSPSVDAYQEGGQLAGKFNIWVEGFSNTNLNRVEQAINAALEKFERQGLTTNDLDRIKAIQETRFFDGYNGISSVLGKAFALSNYNIFVGDPGFITKDIAQVLAVTHNDVMRVYDRYIRQKHFVATSNVPLGRPELALTNSVHVTIEKEPIIDEPRFRPLQPSTKNITSTPSSFDRSVEPPFGSQPPTIGPNIWTASLGNGVKVFGIKQSEVPVIRFTIRLKGGLLLDDRSSVGVANLVAELMMEGTANRTPEELDEAIDLLGSSIETSAGRDSFRLSGRSLKRNFRDTIALVDEILLEPRWSKESFLQAKERTINRIKRQSANPAAVASNTFNKLLYGTANILSENPLGTIESVSSITLDQLRNYYRNYISPKVANIHIVGDISKSEAIAAVSGLGTKWEGVEFNFPEERKPKRTTEARLFFVDRPGSTQSVIRIGALRLPESDPDFFPATIMNLRLGGSFVSRLNQVLREEKGYTYGIISRFAGTDRIGSFTVGTSVRANTTIDSIRLILTILSQYPDGFNEDDLKATKSYLIRSNARALETLSSKIRVLEKVSTLSLSLNYINERQEIVRNITLEEIRQLAHQYTNPNEMFILVVGDRKTQFSGLSSLGLGPPVLLEHKP